jgi:aryl-phospho-beta-D-glucosidase BglC (GH1 family)
MKLKINIIILLFLIFLFEKNNSVAQIKPAEAIVLMQKGINLGNTLEPPNEGGWNNPAVQEYYFDMYKEEGFKLVRIPMRWDEHLGKTPPYKVVDLWMNRMETIVDWALERDLFVVLNSHHDDWIKQNYNETNKARFDSLWTQISNRFKNKSDKLFFEILNEPHGLTKAQNDDMHARVLQIIRKTNPSRIVIFQGHDWGGSDQLLQAAIPQDSFLIGSFHSYDPFQFTHYDEEIGQITWGTSGDITAIDNKFKQVKQWSDENNIPVFLGEFGAQKKCDYNSRMKHYRTYVTLAEKYGFAHCAWDDGGNFRIMERQTKQWNEVKDILLHTYANSPKPVVDVFQDSIVRVRWNNYMWSHDSVLIQRRLGTAINYTTIATLKSDTALFYDIKPAMSKYYSYRIIARYTDSLDLYSEPQQVFFPSWIRQVREPFMGSPLSIPGIIEAEDFDKGGEGLAYHDVDATNISGDYRPNEGVDIYDRLGNGYHIGNALTNEWFSYTVNVQTEGWYKVTSEIAALFGGGTFQIEVDSIKSEILTAPTCYSWLTTKPVETKMYLLSGEHILTFTILSDPLFNIDKISFDLVTATQNIIEQNDLFQVVQNAYQQVIIKQSSNQKLSQINIYNNLGSLVFQVKYPENNFTLSNKGLVPGMYFIQGLAQNQKQTQKIILNE